MLCKDDFICFNLFSPQHPPLWYVATFVRVVSPMVSKIIRGKDKSIVSTIHGSMGSSMSARGVQPLSVKTVYFQVYRMIINQYSKVT